MKDKVKDWVKKNTKKDNLLILALLGILLMVIVIPFGEKNDDGEGKIGGQDNSGGNTAAAGEHGTGNTYEEIYRHEMEQQLEELLESIEGVGETKVMITIAATEEHIVLKDYDTAEGADSVKVTENTIFYVDNNGQEVPFCLKNVAPGIEGVVVVAEGGGDPQKIVEITEVIESLFDVPIHKIRVVRMKSE